MAGFFKVVGSCGKGCFLHGAKILKNFAIRWEVETVHETAEVIREVGGHKQLLIDKAEILTVELALDGNSDKAEALAAAIEKLAENK